MRTFNDRKWPIIIHAAAAVAAAIAILIFSVIPGLPGGGNSGPAAHLCAYGMLSLLLMLCFQTASAARPEIAALVCSAIYGICIECVQYFIPYRSFEVMDMLVNFCGAVLAVVPGRLIMAGFPIYRRNDGDGRCNHQSSRESRMH